MDLFDHFRMLARYNRAANQRLYAQCALLDETEFRRIRPGPFGSIHGLLNHLQLGDGIWMARFEGGGGSTPALDTVLHEDFAGLAGARAAMDERIVDFFDNAGAEVMARGFPYVNNKGRAYVEEAPVAFAHFFNHQTHHRGQVCVMLAATAVPAPSLDLHRIVNP
jgi:uncharacterized damage-inducible protein DinB